MITAPSTPLAEGSAPFARHLRIEGAALLLVALAVYARFGAGWPTFAWLFLVPDVALAAYAAGPVAGARAYNLTHSEVGPALVAIAGIAIVPALVPFALIWFAHIGFDRMLGYGLKSVAGFRLTHLGLVGRRPA